MNDQRDGAAVRFFPPGVPLLAILIAAVLNQLCPIHLLPAPISYWLGGAIILLAVLFFGVWPIVLFRRAGQNENPWKPTPAIETRGPFRVTRNPMYLQMVLLCIGIALAYANGWLLILTPLVVIGLHYLAIIPEERYLERKFGETYLAYKRRVRRWL